MEEGEFGNEGEFMEEGEYDGMDPHMMMAEGEYAMEGEYPEGEYAMEGEYPMEGEYAMEGEYPMEGEYDEETLQQMAALAMQQMEGEYDHEGSPDQFGEHEGDEEHEEHPMETGRSDMEGDEIQMSPGMGEVQDDELEEESEEGLNFANNPEFAHLPPLDQWRKSRRDVLKSINDLRQKDNKKELNIDLLGNKVANAYAEFLLDNRENDDELKKIMERLLFVGKDSECQIGEAFLDLDSSNDDKEIPDCFMDAHGLLFELEKERKTILDEKYTNVAIGFAFNKQQVKIVEIYFRKSIIINQLSGTENEGVDIQGQMLPNEEKKYDFGVYAVRIASLKNLKKDVIMVGPSGIKFDASTQKFSVTFNGPLDAFYSDDEKILELYMRKIPPPIPYGEPTDERINIAHLIVGARMPMVLYPDPRIILEDEADREKEEKKRQDALKQAQEDKLVEEAEKIARHQEMVKKMEQIKVDEKDESESVGGSSAVSGKSKKKKESSRGEKKSVKTPGSERSKGDAGRDSSSEGRSMSKEPKSKRSDSDGEQEESESEIDESRTDGQKEKEDTIEEPADLPSPDEMKRELITAIEEAIRERDQLKGKNQELQKEIITMDSTYEQYDKQPDVSMNEHKYLNTLANVHQVRFNLKETQLRYNKMATELQAKLNEKQAKCDEIQKQFKELKRSVAENSCYSRTGNKIKPEVINEWETKEATKDAEVHHFRFQNIALRNRLANKEKILKKKEQLADGLHLIDFEQLKIENQTLNEKIEERNEELHKLTKKITTAVIILTHTREKLNKSNKLSDEENIVKSQLAKKKKELNEAKAAREKTRKQLQLLKQQTGIVNDDFLNKDYADRKVEIQRLKEEIELLKQHHQRLLQSFKATGDRM